MKKTKKSNVNERHKRQEGQKTMQPIGLLLTIARIRSSGLFRTMFFNVLHCYPMVFVRQHFMQCEPKWEKQSISPNHNFPPKTTKSFALGSLITQSHFDLPISIKLGRHWCISVRNHMPNGLTRKLINVVNNISQYSHLGSNCRRPYLMCYTKEKTAIGCTVFRYMVFRLPAASLIILVFFFRSSVFCLSIPVNLALGESSGNVHVKCVWLIETGTLPRTLRLYCGHVRLNTQLQGILRWEWC